MPDFIINMFIVINLPIPVVLAPKLALVAGTEKKPLFWAEFCCPEFPLAELLTAVVVVVLRKSIILKKELVKKRKQLTEIDKHLILNLYGRSP